jgi:DNA-(apurinic or apyrimidinic site) lyase
LENKEFFNFSEIYLFFEDFIPNSKNNKRFVDTKLNRVKKLYIFYKDFIKKTDFYYKNMEVLLKNLSKIMNQKPDAKTIVFAIKMFSY